MAICKGYREKKDDMKEYFLQQSLSLPQLADCQWRVDYLISSSDVKSLNTPSVRMKLDLDKPTPDGNQEVAFEMTADKLRVLASELKTALDLMKDL